MRACMCQGPADVDKKSTVGARRLTELWTRVSCSFLDSLPAPGDIHVQKHSRKILQGSWAPQEQMSVRANGI